jgi:hypothetical protein
MDKITKHLLEEFSRHHDLVRLPEDKQFEHFAAYLVMTRFHGETFDTADLVAGSGGDTSIDAVGIVVNGSLVTDEEVVDDLAQKNGYLDVTFVFVQAERSSTFESAKIGQIGFGLIDFFSEQPTLTRNERITEAAAIQTAIYERSAKFKRGNPACRIYYVTTGKWQDDQNLRARKDAVVADLMALQIFRQVDFTPVGAEDIHKLYRQSQNAVSRDFEFSTRTVIPSLLGVTEAYLGLLPAPEFLRLIKDDEGALLRSIFYDNVRDWQDYNKVNQGISDTLSTPGLRSRFALMNNGITIIAKILQVTGNRVHIEDYQIVNGCQTSHVLFDQREQLDDTVMIPLRVIATQDEDIMACIIKATNRQTEIREEQLLALSDFQKRLEEFFATFGNGKGLYYERRSRQYYSDPTTEKTRVVTLGGLVRAYASVFLNEPHRATKYYGELLKEIGQTIFVDGERLEPYYVAALASYRLEYLFRNQLLDPKYKRARYHMLMTFRLVTAPDQLPRANSHEMGRYCEPLIELLWDTAKAEQAFRRAAAIVEEVAKGDFDRENVRTQPFTEKLKGYFEKSQRVAKQKARHDG